MNYASVDVTESGGVCGGCCAGEKRRMIIRKLEQNEHGKTRELWEQVFPEDTKEFLDYYYFVKARDNQIYVIEEEGEIRSMLQLNPYEIRIENRVFPSFYIIAVATQKEYRGRGYMGALPARMYAGDVQQKSSVYVSDACGGGNLFALRFPLYL